MRRIIVLLTLIVLVSSVPLIVGAQGGFTSWRSINMTGMGDSYYVVDQQGMGDSRFIMATSSVSVFPPTNLLLTMVGDNEVVITWDAGVNACNYMVRGAIGRLPADRTDGYLVYNGTATTTTDWIDEDETVYYRVFSQSCGGTWETDGIYDSIGGFMVLLLILTIVAVILAIAAFVLKSGRRILAFASAGFWVLAGIHSYTLSEATWDIHYGLFWVSMGMVAAMVLMAAILREKKEIEPEIFDEVTGERIDPEDKEVKPRRQRKSPFSKSGKL